MNPFLRKRLANVRRELASPSFLITDPADLFYLTGINLEGFWMLLGPGETVIFAPRLLAGHLASLLPDFSVKGGDNMPDLLKDYCRAQKIRKVGIDPAKVSLALARRLQRIVRLLVREGGIEKCRTVKDDSEIASIRKACRIASAAVKYARRLIRPGMTEEEISYKIEEYFAQQGVVRSFPTIVASGPNSSNPHHLSSSRRIGKNDVVLIDLGCMCRGYCSDLTRTFFFGKMNRLSKTVYSLVAQAKMQATAEVRSGVKASSVDKAARDVIAAGGYGERFIHSTGHGVGAEVHEAPRLSARDTTILKPAMVITVEPGIYLPGQFGVRLEDTVLVTREGSEVLTR